MWLLVLAHSRPNGLGVSVGALVVSVICSESVVNRDGKNHVRFSFDLAGFDGSKLFLQTLWLVFAVLL